MSILLHHFKELTECIKEIELIDAKVNNNNSGSISINKQRLMKEVKKEEEEKIPATLDGFF
jgi:hypothetical protein